MLWLRPAAAALALAGLVAAGSWIHARAYWRGHADASAAALDARRDLERTLDLRRAELGAAIDQLAEARAARGADLEALEHDTRKAPGADTLVFPADSLRRLRGRWGAD